MNLIAPKFIFFFAIACLFSSCTFTKIIVHFKPNTTDHHKVFHCDTIKGTSIDNWATSSLETMPAAPKPLFVNVHNAKNIPPIQEWIPKSQLSKVKANTFEELLEASKTTAFIVIKNDSILYENYLNGGKKEASRIVFSVTKAITATLTAVAAEEGLLSLDQKVLEFLPEFDKEGLKEITLRHLMGMVSGLKWNDFQNILKLGGLYYNSNQRRFVVKHSKSQSKPGEVFAYKSLSTQILGLCLEKAIGTNLAAYFEAKIWKPVGMQYDAMMTLDSKKKRNPRTFGGIAFTASDMARFGKLMLNDGKWEGQQIIPDWFIDELKKRDLKRWFGYSNCFWRNGYEEENWTQNTAYWAAGFKGQYIYINPTHNTIIVRMGNDEKQRWAVLLGRLSHHIAVGSTDLTNPKLDYGEQFAGTFKSATGQEMTLSLLPERDKYGRREWLWERDKTHFKEGAKLKTLTQFDGISLGDKKLGRQTRMYYKVENGKIVGFYYNTWPVTKLEYFEKVKD